MKKAFITLMLSLLVFSSMGEENSIEKKMITNRDLKDSNLCSLYALYKRGSEFSEDIPKLDCNNGSYILPMNGTIMGGSRQEVLEEVKVILNSAGLNYKGKLPITPNQEDERNGLEVVQHLFIR